MPLILSFILTLLLLLPTHSIARPLNSLELIARAQRNGEINYREALNYRVAAVLRPEGLPEGYLSKVPIKSATPILLEARSNRHLLSPENARVLAKGRGEILAEYYGSGITLHSYMSPGKHFRIHYTTEGDDAVPATDDDGNNIPDYVERFADILDHVWAKEIDEMGYDAPPSDGSEGGDCLLDVYLANLNAYGLTQIDEGMGASTVYMILKNDFSFVLPNSNPGGQQEEGAMKVTAAHEFFHTVQFQISEDLLLNGWWMEASATWMEDHVYPEVNDYVNYIDCWFQHPEWPLDTFGIVATDPACSLLFPYGNAVWVKHMTEKYGSAFVYEVWDRIKNGESALSGVENTLTENGSTLEEELKELRVANVTMIYDDSTVYQTWNQVNPGIGPIAVTYNEIPAQSVVIAPLAARYYSISATGGSKALYVEFNGASNLSLMVIGIRSGGIRYDVTEVDILNDSGSVTINGFSSSGPYTSVILIPLNHSTTDPGSFTLKPSYTASVPHSIQPVEIRPAASAIVAEDTGAGQQGKQQYYMILRDGSGNQILESGTVWTSDLLSVNINVNGLATASDAAAATITASLAGFSASTPLSISAPLIMPPGLPRNCTIKSSDRRCFIATAAFGSPLHPYVEILRELRDRYFLTNPAGRVVISLYYFYSPPIAETIAKYPVLKDIVKICLIPAILFSGFMVKTTLFEKIIVGILLILIGVITIQKSGNRYSHRL